MKICPGTILHVTFFHRNEINPALETNQSFLFRMSDAEEEVKAHPCDQYNIPDCPGKFFLAWIRLLSNFSRRNESPATTVVQDQVLQYLPHQRQVLWRVRTSIRIRSVLTRSSEKTSYGGTKFAYFVPFFRIHEWNSFQEAANDDGVEEAMAGMELEEGKDGKKQVILDDFHTNLIKFVRNVVVVQR